MEQADMQPVTAGSVRCTLFGITRRLVFADHEHNDEDEYLGRDQRGILMYRVELGFVNKSPPETNEKRYQWPGRERQTGSHLSRCPQ